MPNPYHDKMGRFTTKSGGSGGSSIRKTLAAKGRVAATTRANLGAVSEPTFRNIAGSGRNKNTRLSPSVPAGAKSGTNAVAQSIRSTNTKRVKADTRASVASTKTKQSKDSIRKTVAAKGRVAATTRANLGGVSDNGASGGWGSGLVPGKKSDLGLRTPGGSSFSRSVRATNTKRVKADNAAIAKTSRGRSNSKKK